MRNTIISLLIIIFFTTSSVAENHTDAFQKLIGEQPTVEVNLGPTMLKLLSSASQDEDDLSKILSSLSAINVTVFELPDVEDRIGPIKSEINRLANDKKSSGYEKIASIKEDDSLVYVLALMDEEKFSSLSIFALDDSDELVLINIKGDILMSQIGALMDHFDVDLDINGL